jgi:response regulator RpfG family c-di-GMP phosphodiesterase
MKKFDYLNKEEVNTLFYSTISSDRLNSKIVCIDGRWYEKYGTEQAVTFIGKVYKLKNLETNISEYVLHIGMTKQHPNDRHIDKKVAMETAVENCLINPFAVIELETPNINHYMFKRLVSNYLDTMELKFVRTKQEIEKIA